MTRPFLAVLLVFACALSIIAVSGLRPSESSLTGENAPMHAEGPTGPDTGEPAARPNTEASGVSDTDEPIQLDGGLFRSDVGFGSPMGFETWEPRDPVPFRITVQDAAGKVLRGARIQFEKDDSRDAWHRKPRWQMLDEGVRAGLSDGWQAMTFRVWHPLVSESVEATIANRDEAADFRVTLDTAPTGELKVRGILPEGVEQLVFVALLQPVDGGEARIGQSFVGEPISDTGRPAGWDAGRLAPGRWRLMALCPYAPWYCATREVEVKARESRTVELRFSPRLPLEGRVVTAGGNPVGEVNLTVTQSHGFPEPDPGSWHGMHRSWSAGDHSDAAVHHLYYYGVYGSGISCRLLTGKDGRFRFHGFLPGALQLTLGAKVASDGTVYATFGAQGPPRGPGRTTEAVVLRRSIVPTAKPMELALPARGGAVDLELQGDADDFRYWTVNVDGTIRSEEDYQVSGRRIRFSGVDIGERTICVVSYHPRRIGVARVEVREGESARATMKMREVATVHLQDSRGVLRVWWRGGLLYSRQGSIRKERIPAGIPVTITVGSYGDELIPASREVTAQPGASVRLGRMIARERPSTDPRWRRRKP